jgi:hypothetical protein
MCIISIDGVRMAFGGRCLVPAEAIYEWKIWPT